MQGREKRLFFQGFLFPNLSTIIPYFLHSAMKSFTFSFPRDSLFHFQVLVLSKGDRTPISQQTTTQKIAPIALSALTRFPFARNAETP